MKNKEYLNKNILGDSSKILSKLEDNSIDLVLTDPPYFLDKLDNNWDKDEVHSKDNQQTVTSLPAGMKFSREQGERFYEWYKKISKDLFRVLKPGGFFFSFSSPRLYHRLASAMDDAGFEIRECFIWLYTRNQPKAMGFDHLIDRMDIEEDTKKKLKNKFEGWKTPKVKSCFEPIAMGQKPTDSPYYKNMINREVGGINTKVKVGQNMFPANILTVEEMSEAIDKYFLISKPTKEEKGEFNNHMTVKPLSLCEHIIKLATFSEDSIVLDPFVGSGTTTIAAKKLDRKYIGIDVNKEYIEIARERVKSVQPNLL